MGAINARPRGFPAGYGRSAQTVTNLNRLMRPWLFSNDRDFLLSDLIIGLKMGALKLSPLHNPRFRLSTTTYGFAKNTLRESCRNRRRPLGTRQRPQIKREELARVKVPVKLAAPSVVLRESIIITTLFTAGASTVVKRTELFRS